MTAAWTSLSLLSIDCETTGVDTDHDRIVEIAAITIQPDGTVTSSWRHVVHPQISIPEESARIHGITDAIVEATGIHPTEALGELAGMVKRHPGPVVIYNARFDWPLIHTEAERYGIDMPGAMILDPLVLDKHLDRYRRGSRKLIDVAAHYGIQLTADDAHGAIGDATASGLLMLRLMATEPRIGDMGLPGLQTWQQRWSDEQKASFADYRRRTDPTFDEPLGWPLPDWSAA